MYSFYNQILDNECQQIICISDCTDYALLQQITHMMVLSKPYHSKQFRSTHKCSYTICGNCIRTVNSAMDSRLRKPLSNCLSSKVTFNVCSNLLWVKYKLFLPTKCMRRNSIIIFCNIQHNLLSFATNTESIRNILYTSLQELILCFKDDM